jgi:hypothetical protein
LALDFLGVSPADTVRRDRHGLYSAATFGPPGKRLRVILLVRCPSVDTASVYNLYGCAESGPGCTKMLHVSGPKGKSLKDQLRLLDAPWGLWLLEAWPWPTRQTHATSRVPWAT